MADRPTSREAVLTAIRLARVAPSEAPVPWESRPDPDLALGERFAAALADAGGTARFVSRSELPDALNEHADLLRAEAVHSTHPGLASRTPGPAPESPHDLAQLDLAVTAGGPSVAESGAVWLAPADGITRAACFLAEHLVLVIEASEIVADLHDAYARVDPAAASFGCWVAGPSKTADIEQVVVIGAHGARSLVVFVVA